MEKTNWFSFFGFGGRKDNRPYVKEVFKRNEDAFSYYVPVNIEQPENDSSNDAMSPTIDQPSRGLVRENAIGELNRNKENLEEDALLNYEMLPSINQPSTGLNGGQKVVSEQPRKGEIKKRLREGRDECLGCLKTTLQCLAATLLCCVAVSCCGSITYLLGKFFCVAAGCCPPLTVDTAFNCSGGCTPESAEFGGKCAPKAVAQCDCLNPGATTNVIAYGSILAGFVLTCCAGLGVCCDEVWKDYVKDRASKSENLQK